ncbi:MYB-related transcription factor [Quillaja saponaria]|uniref:MYB-related transcription factor n=1 Tax=Quillaja saponaria TaxID=32244 RepID=A0AAD7PAC7_QUISA|nr:MYB-related transcription factor [Quillaja saponaria]
MSNNNNNNNNNNNEGDGGNNEQNFKKGPWTAAEDAVLVEYVKGHGEGNWNDVQKNSGLSRSGKSCRLRWANHLRPNLRKGSFTLEEELIVINLHAKLGNKWASMAAQLNGRTDNEIKNFWNTRMKRRQRAGLPICPQELQTQATIYHVQQQKQEEELEENLTHPHSSSASSQTSIMGRCQRRKLNSSPPTTYFSSFANPLQNQPNYVFYSTPDPQFNFFSENKSNAGVGLPLSPNGSSSSSLFNQSFTDVPSHIASQAKNNDSGSYSYNFNFTSMLAGVPYESVYVFPRLEAEFPSIQTPPLSGDPTSSSYSSGEGFMGATNNCVHDDYYEVFPISKGNSGLLDDVLVEAKNLLRNEKLARMSSESDKGKNVVIYDSTKEEDTMPVKSCLKNGSGENAQSSTWKKPITEDLMDEMINSMDDDLLSLLTNFPSTMPMPEWYRRGAGQPSGASSDNMGLGSTQQHASDASTQEHAWAALGPACRKNLPGIC